MGVPLRAAGKRVRCPKCKEAFRVPSRAEPVAVATEQQSDLNDDLLGDLAGGAAVESDEERHERLAATPKPKAVKTVAPNREKSEAGPRIDVVAWCVKFGAVLFRRDWSSRICCLMLVFGGGFIYLGIQEARLRGRWNAEPQPITCEQLSTNGPGDNLHVVMSDFVLLGWYVYEEGLTGWNGVWVPAVSSQQLDRQVAQFLEVDVDQLDTVADHKWDEALEALDLASFDVRVIVSFPQARNETDVEELGARESVQGTLMDDFASLDGETRTLLRQEYSNVDFDRCSILVAGRRPQSAASSLAFIVGGALSIIVAVSVVARSA